MHLAQIMKHFQQEQYGEVSEYLDIEIYADIFIQSFCKRNYRNAILKIFKQTCIIYTNVQTFAAKQAFADYFLTCRKISVNDDHEKNFPYVQKFETFLTFVENVLRIYEFTSY